MSTEVKLQRKYGFKVKNAPEPSEYTLENSSKSKLLKYLIVIVAISIALGV